MQNCCVFCREVVTLGSHKMKRECEYLSKQKVLLRQCLCMLGNVCFVFLRARSGG